MFSALRRGDIIPSPVECPPEPLTLAPIQLLLVPTCVMNKSNIFELQVYLFITGRSKSAIRPAITFVVSLFLIDRLKEFLQKCKRIA